MKVLGIGRSPRFSPNSVDRDGAIFSAVASRMLRGGNDVSVINEDLFIAVDLSEFDLVFSMARGRDVLTDLAEAETQQGLCVVNSAQALLAATRHELVVSLKEAGIPQPTTQVLTLSTESIPEVPASLKFPLWLKRGDACAQKAGDVRYLATADEWEEALAHFQSQNVKQVIAVAHAEGDLVKFYGVEGTDFFFHTYPTDKGNYSKFGLEEHNGAPQHFAFDLEQLKRTADQAARTTGFTIYGGDAIVRKDGSFLFIDFNDWPSFSACRKEAAKAIAQKLKAMG